MYDVHRKERPAAGGAKQPLAPVALGAHRISLSHFSLPNHGLARNTVLAMNKAELVESIQKALGKDATKRAARQGRNPKTGEAMKIAASKSVGFKASSTLKAGL